MKSDFLIYNLRKGDAIVISRPGTERITAKTGIGVLVKQTKAYWYYFYKGHVARISKTSLWQNLDTHKAVSVIYGSSMKKRRKQRKWRSLDLHGTKHEMVEEKVKSFLNFADLPCRIVTGNSLKMKQMVKEIAKEYGWHTRPALDNDGCLVVEENEIS